MFSGVELGDKKCEHAHLARNHCTFGEAVYILEFIAKYLEMRMIIMRCVI